MRRNSLGGRYPQRSRRRKRKSRFLRDVRELLKDIRRWLERNTRLAVIIGGGLVLVVAIVLVVVLVIVPAAKNGGQEQQSEASEQQQYQEQIESGEIDPDVLAGLTGEGLDESDYITETEEQIVTVGMIVGEGSEAAAEGFGTRAEEIIDGGGSIEQYIVYTVPKDASFNSKVQDVRSLINRGCSVIIIADVDEETYDMATGLAEKNGIAVVAINAPHDKGYTINIKSTASDPTVLLAERAAATSGGGSALVVTAGSGSSFGTDMTSAFSGKGITVSEVIVKGGEGYVDTMLARMAVRPKIVVAERGAAVSALEMGARAGYIGEYFVAEPTAGLVKKWYQMKNGGITVEETTKDSQGNEITTTYVSGFTSNCVLVSVVGADAASEGRAACEFAERLAAGRKLVSGTSYVYELKVTEEITDANIATYYQKYKDADDDVIVAAEADTSDIDALFTAPAASAEGE